MKMGKDIRRLIAASILIFAGMSGYMYLMEGKNFAIWVLLTLWLAMMGISLIFLIFKHAYRYALDADEEVVKAPKREPQTVLKPAEQISQEDKAALRESILEFAPDKVLRYIEKNIDIFSTNTFTLRSTDIYNIRKQPN